MSDTVELDAASVEDLTLRAGVPIAYVEYEVVVRALREEEIVLPELTHRILTYLAKSEVGIDTRAYVSAIHKWRKATIKFKLAQEELAEFE